MNAVRSRWSRFKGLWCSVMHPSPMWPINGYYRCPKCRRTYAVPWQ